MLRIFRLRPFRIKNYQRHDLLAVKPEEVEPGSLFPPQDTVDFPEGIFSIDTIIG